jgi:hypothetical protein
MPSASTVKNNGSIYLDLNDGMGTRVNIADNEPLKGSYSLFLPSVVPVATPTDLLTLSGTGAKNIRLRSLTLTGAATAASNILVNLVRRSTANTGGTSTNQTIVQRDSTDDASTATVKLYTANPTGLGTLVGAYDGARLNLAPPANGGIDRVSFQYSWLNDKAPILRTANEYFCINLAGAAWPAGGLLDISLAWGEE